MSAHATGSMKCPVNTMARCETRKYQKSTEHPMLIQKLPFQRFVRDIAQESRTPRPALQVSRAKGLDSPAEAPTRRR
jgi:hypothetical protein